MRRIREGRGLRFAGFVRHPAPEEYSFHRFVDIRGLRRYKQGVESHGAVESASLFREDFLHRERKASNFTVLGAVFILQFAVFPLMAQQVKPPNKTRPPQVTRPPAQVWRSLTTGKEYSVRVDGQTLYAEWVNVPPPLVQGGAFIRSECRRVGTRWVGISRSYLPCDTMEGNRRVQNWCNLVTRIEIDSMTADRITGRAEALRRFDCERCRIIEKVWAKFEWVPKAETRTPESAPRGKGSGGR